MASAAGTRLGTAARAWIPLAVAVVCMCALVYGGVQHELRTGANDPQIQLTEDAAASLAAGASGSGIVPSQTVDIANSLAPWIVLCDNAGSPVVSSGFLDGKPPILPKGVFTYTLKAGEDRITWQPRPGVRQAVVVRKIQGATGGFAVSGRSLREVEKRVDDLNLEVGIALAFTLAATLLAALVLTRTQPS